MKKVMTRTLRKSDDKDEDTISDDEDYERFAFHAG